MRPPAGPALRRAAKWRLNPPDIANDCLGGAPLLRRRTAVLGTTRRTRRASGPLLQTSCFLARPQDRLSPTRAIRAQWTGHAVGANKRWGRGGGGRRCHLPHGPQALSSQNVQGYNPRGDHGEAGYLECDCSGPEKLGHYQPRGLPLSRSTFAFPRLRSGSAT